MKDHDANRHPGPWRVMRLDSEFAGILVAVGFLVMGLVSMPLATWFVLGSLVLGGVAALLLRYTPKSLIGVVLGTLIVLVVVMLWWWAGRPPQRPHGVSSNALHVEPNNVGITLRRPGYWLDCWFDKDANVDRCKLTDAKGTGLFEDVFIPCVGHTPLPQRELVLDARWTGDTWIQSQNKTINVPVVYLENRQVLLPRSLYTEARQEVHCSADSEATLTSTAISLIDTFLPSTRPALCRTSPSLVIRITPSRHAQD